MKLEKLVLRNFRCFGAEPVTVDLEKEVTALVGGNGSGKTALLLALSRLFGVTPAQRSVQPRDFHRRPAETELLSGASLSIECVLGFPELEDLDADATADAVPDFFNHMAASAPGEPLKARLRLMATWTEDGTPDGTVEEDIRWISTLGDEFDWDTCQKVAAVDRATIQLVYVPASRNAVDRVTDLLKGRLWKAAKWSEKLARTTDRGAMLIQKRFESEAPAQFIIDRLVRRWHQVHEADTDTTPVLRLIENRLEDLVRHVEFAFYPDEAGQERSLADLSDGQRSLFHIALTAATLETERDALALPTADGPFDQEKLRRTHLTILAIEEPENSLAPFFLSRIMEQANEIGGLDSAQVVISSHSASILSRVKPEAVRYFRLDRASRSSQVQALALPQDETEAGQYVRLAVRAYPEIYFARFVILGEGDSERLVLPRLAEAMGTALDPSFVPVVPLGGRYVSHFWRLLTNLHIPYATLLDYDLGRVHGGAGTIRSAVNALAEIGNDLSNNPLVANGSIDLGNLATLDDAHIADRVENNAWLQALQAEGVFFSYPVDLDFSMLSVFRQAYQHPNPGGTGPRSTPADIASKKAITLKTGGNPGLYNAAWDYCFIWYPYLFLNRSKPETHLVSLNRVSDTDLAANAPSELRALINHVQSALAAGQGDD